MIYELYAIQDRLSEFYSPRIFTSKEVAIRDFRDLANADEGMVSKHPYDYSLYYLGRFNAESGCITGLEIPKFVVNAASLKPGSFMNDEEYEDEK